MSKLQADMTSALNIWHTRWSQTTNMITSSFINTDCNYGW